MARPAPGLTLAQAALLLRCQRLREVRLAGEAARCAAASRAATQRAQTAEAEAGAHAAEAGAALRREYGRLVGGAFSLPALDALRAREAAARGRQAALAGAALEAQDQAGRAAAQEAGVRASLAEAGRRTARRGRLLDDARRQQARAAAARDEGRGEDGHAALRAWRG